MNQPTRQDPTPAAGQQSDQTLPPSPGQQTGQALPPSASQQTGQEQPPSADQKQHPSTIQQNGQVVSPAVSQELRPSAGQVQHQPVGQPALSTGSVLTQVSSVLAGIILLILACAWLAKRLGFVQKGQVRGLNDLTISASCKMGQRERVVIVDVEDARLVLGVTAQQITHLHTLPPKPPQEHPAPSAVTADFRQVLQTLIKRPGKPQ